MTDPFGPSAEIAAVARLVSGGRGGRTRRAGARSEAGTAAGEVSGPEVMRVACATFPGERAGSALGSSGGLAPRLVPSAGTTPEAGAASPRRAAAPGRAPASATDRRPAGARR